MFSKIFFFKLLFIIESINCFQLNYDNLQIMGLSYKSVPKQIQEKIYINPSNIDEFLLTKNISFKNDISILSTCNRLEVIFFNKNFESEKEKEIKKNIFHFEKVHIYKNKEALEYFCYIATGIKSEIFGDEQITYQIKQCYKKLKCKKLIRLFNEVLHISRKARNELQVKRQSTCISSICVKYIHDICKNIKEKKICIIGYGNIGKKIYKCLINRNILDKNIEVYNSKNVSLINNSKNYDIVFTASSNKLDLNFENNLMIIDLGFPSNVKNWQSFFYRTKNCNIKKTNYYNLTFFENISKQNSEYIHKKTKEIKEYIKKKIKI